MERKSNPVQPIMCRSGCGFYGNPATDGLCSVCYKESLRKKQIPSVSNTPVSVPSPQSTPAFSRPTIKVTSTVQPTVQSLQKHNEIKEEINEGNTSVSENVTTSSVGPSTSTITEDDDKEGEKVAKKKKNRCAVCRKKVGLSENFLSTGLECRCGGLFCAVHRYSDKHDCTFDYREHGAQEIRRNNPVVVREKIQKI